MEAPIRTPAFHTPTPSNAAPETADADRKPALLKKGRRLPLSKPSPLGMLVQGFFDPNPGGRPPVEGAHFLGIGPIGAKGRIGVGSIKRGSTISRYRSK